jgi:hypothetical protein
VNAIPTFFFKSWIRCLLTLVALVSVLCVVQQGISRRHPPAVVPSASRTPLPETRARTGPTAEAELPRVEISVSATPKESSSVLAETNGVAPDSPTLVSAPATEAAAVSTVSSQTIAPPLTRAVPVGRSAAFLGIGPSGNSGAPRLDPPLAFTVDPKNLTPQQQTTLATIQNQFLQAIGDANQDPADPAYSQRWMDAQSIADQTYRAFFGWTAFTQMQLQRARNSYTEIQSP